MPLLTAFPLMDKVREAITPKVDAGSVKLRIRQTWTKAAATLEVHGTVYESSSCVIAVGNEITQKVILHFSQTEQDKPSNADSIGSNLILSVDFSEAEAPKGRFFSDRGVTGTVVFDDSRR